MALMNCLQLVRRYVDTYTCTPSLYCDLIYDANHLISEPADAFSAQQKLLHGWENKNGLLVPTKYLKPLPENILFTCGCATTCDTKRCKCFNNEN